MNDLRQGLTPTQHAVLDLIEEMAPEWSTTYPDFDDRLDQARYRAMTATCATSLTRKRDKVIEAAARLIDVADEIDQLINAGVA